MSVLAEPSPDQPWLVADIGGTNARFGLVIEPGGAPHRIKIFRCAYHPDLVSAVEAYLEYISDTALPRTACIAVAGPIRGDRFRLTNAAWDISIAESRRRLGFDQLELVNDFTALAMSVPGLSRDAVLRIGEASRVRGEPIAVIGPGTGLGVAGLLNAGGRWVPVDGEGGHVTIPAETDRELAVVRVLRTQQPAVSAETVLCGPGIVRLHQCISLLDGTPASTMRSEEICQRGRTGMDPACTEALWMFCALLGAFAGNVALTFGARGGVLLGGGILPTVVDILEQTDFRTRFEQKPPMIDYLSPIATEVIVAPTPALAGASTWLTQQRGALCAA
ncbi:MAG: glucokinase [Haloechinothrix sp.]